MRKTIIRTLLVTSIAATSLMAVGSPVNGAPPPCPASFTLTAVTDFPNPPYKMPSQLDEEDGSPNGLICARQLKNQTAEYEGEQWPLYQFKNDRT